MRPTNRSRISLGIRLILCTAFLFLVAPPAFAVGHADVAVTKTNDTGGTANAGQTVTYTINLHNFGPNGATQIHIEDTMNAHLINIVANATVPDDCAVVGQDILCDIQGIGKNRDDTIIITAEVDPATPADTIITNCATITNAHQNDPDLTNNTGCDGDGFTVVSCQADLAIVKTATDTNGDPLPGTPLPNTVVGNTNFKYHIVVTNNGAGNATNSTVTDILPAGVTYVSDPAGCDTSALPTLSCNLGTIGAGSNTSFDITVTAVDSGPIANTATVTSDVECGSSADNTSSVDVNVSTVNTPTALEADREAFSGTVSDVNRVFEPNETVRVDPVWLNNLDNAEPDVLGTASLFTGPGDGSTATYAIVDTTADYGPIPAHTESDCNVATTDCYEMQALQTDPSVRPHLADHPRHWDTTFLETLSTNETKTWTLHIGDSFLDVARSNVFYRFIETIFHNHITIGCGTGVDFCPLANTIRTEMAAFIARSVEGRDSLVPVSGTGYDCISGGTSLYTDVPPTHGYCKYINDMKDKLIITGCSIASQTTYCPTLFVIRGDMATYVARAVEYLPPNNNTADPDAAVPTSGTDGALRSYDCTTPGGGPFLDVTNASPYCKYVGFLWVNHIVDGDGVGHFFPLNNIKRDEEAKILANAFVSLPLYGPLTF